MTIEYDDSLPRKAILKLKNKVARSTIQLVIKGGHFGGSTGEVAVVMSTAQGHSLEQIQAKYDELEPKYHILDGDRLVIEESLTFEIKAPMGRLPR